MRKSRFFCACILSFIIIFSCTNITNTSIVTQGKKTLASPTFLTTDNKVEYGTVIRFDYSPSDANLYYTTDGTEPDLSSKDSLFYDPSKGITLKESCTIKARLYHSKYNESPVVENKFSVYISDPTIDPDKDEITTSEKITLAHNIYGTKIYYTTNGSEPTEDLDEYEEPFALPAGNYTIKALAVRGSIKSKVIEHRYSVIDAEGAYLDSLEVIDSNGTNYLENFKRTQNEYTVGVPYGVNSVTVKAESASCTVALTPNNEELALEPGVTQTISVRVESKTAKINMYTLLITRAEENASNVSALSSLQLLAGDDSIDLSPKFSESTTNYTATVDYNVKSAAMLFTIKDVGASADKVSGTTYDLKEGETTLSVKVTAANQINSTTYTIKVTRKAEEKNSNANLKSVTVDGKSIAVSGSMTVSTSESKVKITVTPEEEGATVKINGQSLTGLEVSVPSTVTITVTAEDKTTTKTYTLNIEKSSTAELLSLTVNSENVPVSSIMNINSDNTSAEITAVVNDNTKNFTIDGQSATSGKACTVKVSEDGSSADKMIEIVLTSTDGGTVTYTLIVHYKAVITDRIVLHAYGYINCYVWETSDSSINQKHFTMTKEGNSSWYTYTFNVTKANIIFTKATGGWSEQTANLSRDAGEWWYKDGNWTDFNPEDTAKPVIVSFTSDQTGTVSNNVTFTISATDDKNLAKIELMLDSTTIASITASGTVYSTTYKWDSGEVPNGSYTITAVAIDSAGNISDGVSLNLKTDNANRPPVAVISGAGRVSPGATVTFSGASSYDPNGTIASYEWEVSGATTIKNGNNKQTCEVIFPENETTVTLYLTVTDNEGAKSETASKTIEVKEKVSSDFREETIYFVMTTRFYDGDPSNNEYCWDEGGEYLPFGSPSDCAWRGDFKGLAEKLDYIKALGFSAIWITPVVQNASGIDYHGYHAYDFSTVDPRYESTDYKYQDFINACHAKGIKVIQDIVLNHTGNFGEKNLFHMFDKETTPYVNKDIPTPTSTPRSPFMKVAKNGKQYNHLMKGLSMAGASDYDTAAGGVQYGARINAMKEDSIDTDFIYHHAKMIDWNSENCQLGQMAGDCVDLNTENPTVFKYLRDAYIKYIEMGVDAFRIDTVKHISRLTFNKAFIPEFMQAGGENFYIFGETCARYRGRWNEGVPALSPAFYTWKEEDSFPWSDTDHKTNSASATAHFEKYKSSFNHPTRDGEIANHLLKGNEYHAPDYSMRSYLDQIDFPMHWAFREAGDAFRTAVDTNDPDFNDATWNVTYVDSHDYAPDNAPEDKRFNGYWPDKLNLIFTFRGIPCIYYGSEIEFQKGLCIDPANGRVPLEKSGRAYFGDHLKGSVTATGYGDFTASGTVASTLKHDLAQHIIRLNKIRRAIPALQKGQYSTQGCNGQIAFKRRYTADGTDSFACVAINGSATFTGVPNGNYTEVITGTRVSGSTITTDAIGQGNMRIYVLDNDHAYSKIGEDGAYLKK
ncbi:MAG: cadherin-like beta sandwich domain-containing protein [Spirochaetales bacterium]|nr:cadherin-like beta sandwich domain-containing protein [Spirochaetales bacterium]